MDYFELILQYTFTDNCRIGKRISGRKPVPNAFRCHRFRQNTYDGKRHPAIHGETAAEGGQARFRIWIISAVPLMDVREVRIFI